MSMDGFEDEVASGAYLGYPGTPVTFRVYFGEQTRSVSYLPFQWRPDVLGRVLGNVTSIHFQQRVCKISAHLLRSQNVQRLPMSS